MFVFRRPFCNVELYQKLEMLFADLMLNFWRCELVEYEILNCLKFSEQELKLLVPTIVCSGGKQLHTQQPALTRKDPCPPTLELMQHYLIRHDWLRL